ncbi:GNAT family N-acetyltransferase [Bacillus solimangrovi]|nr:GNAT family N-acetyltransferase [Bacillus solimangrovi]
MMNANRILLRQYTDDDFDFLFSLLSDPKVVQFIGSGQTRDKEGAERFLEWIYSTYKVSSDLGLRVIVRKDDNIPIGHAGLVPQIVDSKQEVEIGYWIAREYWGQGYATEAAKTLLDYGVEQLKYQRFIALIQPGNIASSNVAQKLGMHLEKEIILSGQDVNVYTISIEESS